jgi:hypothetical protein
VLQVLQVLLRVVLQVVLHARSACRRPRRHAGGWVVLLQVLLQVLQVLQVVLHE